MIDIYIAQKNRPINEYSIKLEEESKGDRKQFSSSQNTILKSPLLKIKTWITFPLVYQELL